MSQEHLKKIGIASAFLFTLIMFSIRLGFLLNSSGYTSYDGAFYADIALHVYEGNGPLTSNSSFDQFYHDLPRPAQVYLLWPLLAGTLAHLLPDSILFVVKLNMINLVFSMLNFLALYFLVLNLLQGFGAKKYWMATAVSATFYSTATYFSYVVKPYTESVTLLVISLSLLCFFKLLDGVKGRLKEIGFAVLLGLLLFLSFLGRSQSALFLFVLFGYSLYFLYKKDLKKEVFWRTWGLAGLLFILYALYLYSIRGEHFELSSLLVFQNNYDYYKYLPLKHTSDLPLYERVIDGLLIFFSMEYISGWGNGGILIYFLPITLFFYKEYPIKFKVLISVGGIYLLSLLNMDMTLTLKRLFGHRHGILISFLTLFSFLAFILYLLKEKPWRKMRILLFMVVVLGLTITSSILVRSQGKAKKYTHKISYTMMDEVYDFLKKEEVRLGRKVKLISLNARNLAFYSRSLGYFFESRREKWLPYLIYKMKHMNIDYFVINKHYDYYTDDKKVDYYTIMKQKTPKAFRLVKSFEEVKTDNWVGIYQRTK